MARPGPRAVAACVLAVLCAVGAWLLVQGAVHTDIFPPFVAGTSSTSIKRYSGPFLTAAAGAALLAALLLVAAVTDLRRHGRYSRSASAAISSAAL